MEFEIDELDSDCWALLESDCLEANRVPNWLRESWGGQTGVLIPEETPPPPVAEPAFEPVD